MKHLILVAIGVGLVGGALAALPGAVSAAPPPPCSGIILTPSGPVAYNDCIPPSGSPFAQNANGTFQTWYGQAVPASEVPGQGPAGGLLGGHP